MKYSAVQYDPETRKVVGKTDEYGDEINFTADLRLLAVHLAIRFNSKSITKFMDLADGYGVRGFFPDGYDWSGIRDSSEVAKSLMFHKATHELRPFKAELSAMGLPAELVNDLAA